MLIKIWLNLFSWCGDSDVNILQNRQTNGLLVVNHKTLKLYSLFITRKWGKVLFWSVSLLPQLDNMSSPAGAIPSIFILNTFWSRLNTTNSTSSVTYETGLNSLLSVVDSYQASSSIILLDPCWLFLFVDDPDIDPAHPGGGVEGGSDGGDGRSKSFSHCRQPSQPQLAPYLLLQVMLITKMVESDNDKLSSGKRTL